MAITNHERVGKALDLLRKGLAPFIERELIHAEVPGGAPEQVVRTVTENARTLKFTSQGFESD